jgi:hypothetical protein
MNVRLKLDYVRYFQKNPILGYRIGQRRFTGYCLRNQQIVLPGELKLMILLIFHDADESINLTG